MFLYLVRHAEAKNEEEDPLRPLSDKGFRDARRMAAYVSELSPNVTLILHSPKLRARQTAKILAETLTPPDGLAETDGLAPLDDPALWAERLTTMSDSLMLVGHLPHIGKLSSFLLCGDPDKDVLSFTMVAIACLKRDEKRTWSMQWMMTPEIIH